MPKFRQALFINFHGEHNSIFSQQSKSFFYQKDKSIEREYSIKMHSEKKRTCLYKDTIPFVRINFPYGEDDKECKEEFNISKSKSNYNIANELMGKELKKIQPYSRIYINAHGGRGADYITQYIKVPAQTGLKSYKISSYDIAYLLYTYIPSYSKNNFQVFLLACNPVEFASLLMIYLDYFGFKKTSVVCYNSKSQPYSLLKNSKNEFNIKDYSTEDRNCCLLTALTGHFKHGPKYKDNKIVYHNYRGFYEKIGSREFDKEYIQKKDFISIHNNTGDLKPAQLEVVLFQNILFQSLAGYLDNYEQRLYHGIIHRHGDIGYKRAMYFCDQILVVKTEDIINGSNTETISHYIISEIKAFANQAKGYSKFAGNCLFSKKINVNDNSAMTKILYGLQQFYQLVPKPISALLEQFQTNLGLDQTDLSVQENRAKLLQILKISEPDLLGLNSDGMTQDFLSTKCGKNINIYKEGFYRQCYENNEKDYSSDGDCYTGIQDVNSQQDIENNMFHVEFKCINCGSEFGVQTQQNIFIYNCPQCKLPCSK